MMLPTAQMFFYGAGKGTEFTLSLPTQITGSIALLP